MMVGAGADACEGPFQAPRPTPSMACILPSHLGPLGAPAPQAQHPLAILEVLDMADSGLHTVLRAGIGVRGGQALLSVEVAGCAIALVGPGAALPAG